MFKNVRLLVFLPTFLVLSGGIVASFIDLDSFLKTVTAINSYLLANCAWFLSGMSLMMVITALIVYLSPLGKVRIGGNDAAPLLSLRQLFSITLCTTIAVGALFWATAEPLYHLHSPPASLGIDANSSQAKLFAMGNIFLEWGITPYAIYGIPSILFAILFYNYKTPFSVTSLFYPILGDRLGNGNSALRQLIDSLCLFALVAGMASSLGTGSITLAGALKQIFPPLEGYSTITLGAVMFAIVISFALSAVSGLKKGIARLSSINTWIMLGTIIFVFVFGPTVLILNFGIESFGYYANNFFKLSLFTGAAANDPWPGWWPVFYWAVWFAWAPITCLFLGRLLKGYTVRTSMIMIIVLPALFSMTWMTILGTTAMEVDSATGNSLNALLNSSGIDAVLYETFKSLPISGIMIVVLFVVGFLNYVTAADSSTDAISNLCTSGVFSENVESDISLRQKIVWACIIGLTAFIMVNYTGLKGVKMLANLGGFPAALICTVAMIALLKLVFLASRAEAEQKSPIELPKL
ncbi:BCCT family transporter [Desulforhopalus singaporensis]|uniref:Choline-glycine betaine transporter n=1 Tax=Desulforhopalus singaporensis TaxID=91360 RepID=A0A1H0RTF2_9BACT|nr:BCCT family transporter [Desulforhopalus singaporensis]SDP32700.1 Choline-glycine betaine transporter [Desulforhopalus singaporensis]